MSVRQRTEIRQSQKLRLSLGLTASIRVLRHDASGLALYLEEQTAQNPHLRIDPPVIVPGEWLPRWHGVFGRDRPDETVLTSVEPSLMAHVTAEITRIFTKDRSRRTAMVFAAALEPSGWLGASLTQIAADAGVTPEEAAHTLRRLQDIEPAGLFARSLAECLELQAREAGWLDPPMAVVLAHLDLLACGDIARLARLAGVEPPDIALRLRRLRGFNPKPGTQFDPGSAPVREPDLCARKGAEGWSVELNRSALPALRVVPPQRGDADAVSREQVAAARALVRQVEARGATLLRLAQEILLRQSGVLEHGLRTLRPMTMLDLAIATGLHESTISRAVAGTSIDTPCGTFWLRHMFSGAVGQQPDAPSAAAIRARLADLVAAEDTAAPLSDADLADALGAPSRRTVAKYRAMLSIPPAYRRRR